MNIMMITNVSKVFLSKHRELTRIFAEPELRAPFYDEMVSDMGHIIHKVASRYVDTSCVALHFDELVAECWQKTTIMNSSGLIKRSRTRAEYFRQYKTAIVNHICSLVQRHRFTEKRTGVKPPPKNDRQRPVEQTVHAVEVRIDDAESNVQLSEIESGDDSAAFREILEEVATRLNSLENLVLQQLLSPNDTSLFYAKLEAEIGRKHNDPLKVRIRYEHLAQGIGISVEMFHQVHAAIKEKCLFMKNNQDHEDTRYTAALTTLIQFFNVQIPRSIEETVRKRALLIAAQHQYDRLKDNAGIREAMAICGIPIPEVRNDQFKCFGVMFQKHHRTCNNCSVNEACETKAINFGLGTEITLSNKLLGSRHARVPVVSPSRHTIDSAVSDERDEEILNFLDENFRRVNQTGITYYRHKDRTAMTGKGNEPMIFSIEHTAPLKVRFINPAKELKPSLMPESTGGRPSWCLPETLSAEEAINLVRAHAQVTFTKA